MAYNFGNYFQFGQNLPTQIQNNNGFVLVRSETEARNYPVAYGNSVTFKDETSPYIYTKTMGFSQMDAPTFEKFKLVKEDAELAHINEETDKPNTLSFDKFNADIDAIWTEIKAIKERMDSYEYAPA